MSQEDNELEKLKAKRLAEMEKNLSSQRQQKEFQSSQEEEKKNQPTHREIVVKRLGYRGLEVLQNAEYQFPKETQIIIQKLAELISSGDIKEVLDGGQLFALWVGGDLQPLELLTDDDLMNRVGADPPRCWPMWSDVTRLVQFGLSGVGVGLTPRPNIETARVIVTGKVEVHQESPGSG